jgi:hypothetical protein
VLFLCPLGAGVRVTSLGGGRRVSQPPAPEGRTSDVIIARRRGIVEQEKQTFHRCGIYSRPPTLGLIRIQQHARGAEIYSVSNFRACRLRSIPPRVVALDQSGVRVGRAEQQNEYLHRNRRHRCGHFCGRVFRTAVALIVIRARWRCFSLHDHRARADSENT